MKLTAVALPKLCVPRLIQVVFLRCMERLPFIFAVILSLLPFDLVHQAGPLPSSIVVA
jgi:hypothetical protein